MDILEATIKGDYEAVKMLIDQGADISVPDKYGFTALMKASEHGHLDIVKLLISNGADVNQKNLLGWSSLCYAATRRHLPVVILLVENGADINADCQGRPIIKWVLQQATDHQSDEEKLLEIIEYLVGKGVIADGRTLDFAREVHRDKSFQGHSGGHINDTANQTDQNYDIGHIDRTSNTVHSSTNTVSCPYCGKELSPLTSGLLLQSDKLADYQTQCSYCKRMISKKSITAAEPKKRKFWEIWK